jgi:pimeloyl-ACP methyl ester carboxylesterase
LSVAIRRAYVDNLYGQLHYRVARPEVGGDRPALLCLHQTPRSGWEWEPIIPGLARERVVLAPDTPGYGNSDAPPQPVGIPQFGEAMIRFMDDMQASGQAPAGPFDIIGYHTGCVTATHMARTWPDRVRRIVLIGLAAYDAEARAARLANIGRFPIPETNDLSHVQRLWDLTETMIDPRASPQWRHRALAESLTTGVRLPWGFRAVYDFDFHAAMAQVAQPVMVINLGDDLQAVTEANYERYADVRKVDIPEAAHGAMTLEPERFVQLVGDFLDQGTETS